MTLEARYPGTCVDCEEPINVGDPIRQTEDGWTHDRPCAGSIAGKTQNVCLKCWLVHPEGGCDRD